VDGRARDGEPTSEFCGQLAARLADRHRLVRWFEELKARALATGRASK